MQSGMTRLGCGSSADCRFVLAMASMVGEKYVTIQHFEWLQDVVSCIAQETHNNSNSIDTAAASMTASLDDLSRRIGDLHGDVLQHSETISSLSTRNAELAADLRDMRREIDELKAENQALRDLVMSQGAN
jgi:chromosome segregation ATPase